MESIYRLGTKVGRKIHYQGIDFSFFSGTSYLGIGSLKDFEEKIIEGFQRYGISHGLSRINNVQLDVYERFETTFAKAARAEDAIVWSSGFLAGITAVDFLKKQHEHIWVAPGTHPAILPAGIPIPTRISWEAWKKWCTEAAADLIPSDILILSNSVDVLHPKVHDFNWIRELPTKHRYTLLIDDSHGFGILGEDIFGSYRLWTDLPVNLLVSGSLGKGLSLPAGIIVGPRSTLDGIRMTATYRGASPPPPGYLFAFVESMGLFDLQRKKLLTNMAFVQSLEAFSRLEHDPMFPVYTFPNTDWVSALETEGVIVSSFPYPTPDDPCINRIVISAAHEIDDLERLDTLLTQLLKLEKS